VADTGAPWNIPYAEPTDLVRDWPALSEDVAEAVADGLDDAAVDRIARTGTDVTQVRVGDAGQISVADATSPSPIVRNLPFAMATGRLNSSASAGVTVTFPSGLFTAEPRVVITPVDVNPRFPIVTAVSSTSFTFEAYSVAPTRSTVSCAYVAVQLTT
jgi:hypothetical protein